MPVALDPRRNISAVDVVLITHLHGDHVNGLVTPAGQAVFTTAQICSAKADNDFWLSEEIVAEAPKNFQPFFKMSRDAAAPYLASGQWKTFTRNRELLPGISSVDTHAHTPGHTRYVVADGDEKPLILGNLVHNHAVQFARPGTSFEYDNDRKPQRYRAYRENLPRSHGRKDTISSAG